METFIVGGNFGDIPKESSIVKKIAAEFDNAVCFNGGNLTSMPVAVRSDLIIWMPNIVNETPKQYPQKGRGDILICSKVMREGYKKIDAVSRIFSMRGNAVIAIYQESPMMRFELIDALANVWYSGSSIQELCVAINKFYVFCKESVRKETTRKDVEFQRPDDLGEFIELNKRLKDHIQSHCGERFFGNISTRCTKLFPTMKLWETAMFVSPRNSNKEYIMPEDMIFCQSHGKEITYSGVNKPSVDTPVQMQLYFDHPHINYMIHGHAFVRNAESTEHYYVCGDMREVAEVNKLIAENRLDYGTVNLKNHGFLMYANTLDQMRNLINCSSFDYERKDSI